MKRVDINEVCKDRYFRLWRKTSPQPVLSELFINKTEENDLDKITSFKNPSRNNDYMKDLNVSYFLSR